MPGIILMIAVVGIYLGIYKDDNCGDSRELENLLEQISRDESD